VCWELCAYCLIVFNVNTLLSRGFGPNLRHDQLMGLVHMKNLA